MGSAGTFGGACFQGLNVDAELGFRDRNPNLEEILP